MKTYEAMCVFMPETVAVERGTNQVRQALLANGAVVVQEENMGLRKLAYTIRKQVQAHYVCFVVSMEENVASKIYAELKPVADLLRFLLVKK